MLIYVLIYCTSTCAANFSINLSSPRSAHFYQSLFLPWGWFFVDVFSSACSVIRTDGNRGQVCAVTSELTYFYTCIVKKNCLVTAICLVRLFQILCDWLLFCVTQKKVGKVAFFPIQSMSVGTIGMSIWLPTFKKKIFFVFHGRKLYIFGTKREGFHFWVNNPLTPLFCKCRNLRTVILMSCMIY